MSSMINQCVVSFLVEFITVNVLDGRRNNKGLGGHVCVTFMCVHVCIHTFMSASLLVSERIYVCLYLCMVHLHMWTSVCMCLGGEMEEMGSLISLHCLSPEP